MHWTSYWWGISKGNINLKSFCLDLYLETQPWKSDWRNNMLLKAVHYYATGYFLSSCAEINVTPRWCEYKHLVSLSSWVWNLRTCSSKTVASACVGFSDTCLLSGSRPAVENVFLCISLIIQSGLAEQAVNKQRARFSWATFNRWWFIFKRELTRPSWSVQN